MSPSSDLQQVKETGNSSTFGPLTVWSVKLNADFRFLPDRSSILKDGSSYIARTPLPLLAYLWSYCKF